jgi:hypothetical protein
MEMSPRNPLYNYHILIETFLKIQVEDGEDGREKTHPSAPHGQEPSLISPAICTALSQGLQRKKEKLSWNICEAIPSQFLKIKGRYT